MNYSVLKMSERLGGLVPVDVYFLSQHCVGKKVFLKTTAALRQEDAKFNMNFFGNSSIES